MMGFLLLLRMHIIISMQALKGLCGRGILFFFIPLKSQYFKRNYSTTERKNLNSSEAPAGAVSEGMKEHVWCQTIAILHLTLQP